MVLALVFTFLSFFSRSCDALEYDAYDNTSLVYHHSHSMREFQPISFQICVLECERRPHCLTVNYNWEHLKCELSDVSHHVNGIGMVPSAMRTYVILTERKSLCNGCARHDSCVETSLGQGMCIATECSDSGPELSNSIRTRTFHPPKMTFTCMAGYTGVGSVSTSTCMPGHPWSSINFRCEPPVNGGWSGWNSQGNCSVTCGGGSMSMSRSCNNPSPKYGGANCAGPSTSTTTCNTNSCPIDGDWSLWSSWSTCSMTCGGGSRSRSRSCSNPSPSSDGTPCSGTSTETAASGDYFIPLSLMRLWKDPFADLFTTVPCGTT